MAFMRTLLVVLTLVLGIGVASQALANGSCFNCGSGSTNGCQQCRYSKDTQEARKACESRGCKITGTGMCSSAANVKVCAVSTPVEKPTPAAVAAAEASIPWCAPAL